MIMIVIRVSRSHWGKALLAMTEVGPVHVIAKDPLIEVLPAHLEVLKARGLSYEIVTPVRRTAQRRHAKSD